MEGLTPRQKRELGKKRHREAVARSRESVTNRQRKQKAKQLAAVPTADSTPITPVPAFATDDISAEEKVVIESKPVSAARRAFQDV